jgi:LCP family protein required for cell wall assembly
VRKPRRAARILSWIAVVLSVSVLAAAGTGYALLNHYDGNINKLAGVFDRSKAPPAAPNDAENYLIVGSDTRGDLKPGQGTQGRGATFVTGQRSDTVILAHLYGGKSTKVQLVSFPRDSVVEIPEYTDPRTGKVTAAQRNRINHAFSEGGPKLLVETVQNLTGVRIDHYLQVDFNGFQAMVDKLGGVDVCLSRPAKDGFSGINLSAGRHHINGKVALSFVRQRKGLANGDIDRIKRQQQFIGAMVRKVLSAGVLANPLKLNGFLNIATSSLQADEDLDFKQLRNLAFRMRNVGAGNVIFATIPVSNSNAFDRRLGSVVLIDEEKADALFDQIRRDVPPGTPKPKPTPGAADGAPLTVAPSAIRVKVYNASGVNGLGRKADTALADLGFQTVGSPETRGSGASATTTVLYGPDKADSARTLVAAIPGSTARLDPALGRVLQVEVGTSYTGVKPVQVSRPPTAAPVASPSPSVVTALDDPCAA